MALYLGAGVLLLLVLIVALAARVRRRRRRRVRRHPKVLRYPLVLAHGVFGFDAIELAGKRHEYFRGFIKHLRDRGAEVLTVRLSPTAPIAERAAELAKAVRALKARRVNIVAHSMGGLDARFAISRLKLHKRVASLTTIGTPHLGTPLADLGTELFGDKLGLKRMCAALSIDVGAFYDLTTSRMLEFNRAVPNVRSVSYASFVGICGLGAVRKINPFLLPSYYYLSRSHGENDGLVPAASQVWGELLGRIDADHWAQIGWSSHFDTATFYAQVLDELRQRGF